MTKERRHIPQDWVKCDLCGWEQSPTQFLGESFGVMDPRGIVKDIDLCRRCVTTIRAHIYISDGQKQKSAAIEADASGGG